MSLSLDSNTVLIGYVDRVIGVWEKGERTPELIHKDIEEIISDPDLWVEENVLLKNLKDKISSCENLELKSYLKKLRAAIKEPFSFKEGLANEIHSSQDEIQSSQGSYGSLKSSQG